MDKSWHYKNRVIKTDVVVEKENKEKLREKISKDVAAYVNSGGQIQKCTPCAYSDIVVMTSAQKKKMNKIFRRDVLYKD